MAISNNKSKTKVDYTAEGKNHYKTPWDNEIKTTNTLYDGQVKSINEGYDTKVFEQGRAYEDQYRENAVQKAINERQVAESMANLGLRDSGLNRTQQTAVQLSYGNNKASIDRQRQAGIDSLEFSRRQSLDTIEQNRTAAIADINQYYNNLAIEYGEGLKAKDEAVAESKKTEAKNLVLSFLEIGAEPPKDILALSGMSNSEIKAYKNYYKKALSKTSAKTTKGDVGNNKPTAYKLSASEVNKIKEIFNEHNGGNEGYKKAVEYLTVLGKAPETDAARKIVEMALDYEYANGIDKELENNQKTNGGSFYSTVLANLKDMKSSGKGTSEVYSYLKELLDNKFLSQSEYMTLYNKYRNNKLS